MRILYATNINAKEILKLDEVFEKKTSWNQLGVCPKKLRILGGLEKKHVDRAEAMEFCAQKDELVNGHTFVGKKTVQRMMIFVGLFLENKQ